MMIWETLTSLYSASPVALWLAAVMVALVLFTYLLVFSLCRASGQADELTEQMIAKQHK